MADDGEVDDDEPRLRKDTPAQVLRTTWEFQTARASAVLYAIAMIVDLGWVTVFTGGSFYSPYAQLLLGCALLAPYVANGVRSGVLMGLTSLTSYAVFGYLFPFKELSENVPLHLVFLTTVLATLISLLTMNIRAIFRWIKEHVAQLEITEVDPAA
jgi:hypothetical protein